MIAGLAGAALAWLPASAPAQGNPCCDGRVQAASFYSTFTATGMPTVTYWVIVQSMVGQRQSVAVTFSHPQVVGTAHGAVVTRIVPWGTSQPIMLGISTRADPSGTGVLNVPSDLVAGTRMSCSNMRRPDV